MVSPRPQPSTSVLWAGSPLTNQGALYKETPWALFELDQILTQNTFSRGTAGVLIKAGKLDQQIKRPRPKLRPAMEVVYGKGSMPETH